MNAITLSAPVSRSLAATARAAAAQRCLSSVVEDTRAAARRELGLERLSSPLARTVDALAERVYLRVAAAAQAPAQNLAARLQARLTEQYSTEISSRGGETSIEEKSRSIDLEIVDRAGGLALLRAEGWRHYSSRFGARHAEIAYLAGRDDNGPWAVRVPGNLTDVSAALQWVEPKAVREARAEGRQVLRQGDVYAVEAKRDRAAVDAAELPARHHWDAATRTLQHDDAERPHAPLHVPFRARLVPQRVYQMGRTSRRGRGD